MFINIDDTLGHEKRLSKFQKKSIHRAHVSNYNKITNLENNNKKTI